MKRETPADFAEDYLNKGDLRETGYGGTEEQWRHGREIILDAVTKDGSFLDLGAANGRLAEDLQIWAAERGITLDVYGVDFVPELIRKAKARSGVHPDHFFVADVNTFIPGRSFDYIRSETNYFKSPSHLQRYIDYLEPGGKLIITKYDDDTGSEFDEFEEKIRKLNWGPVSVYRNAQTCLVVIEKQTSHVAK